MPYRTRREKLRTKSKKTVLILLVLLMIVLLSAFIIFKSLQKPEKSSLQAVSTDKSSVSSSSTSKISESKKTDLPNAHQSDWDLVLVNRENIKAEMNPVLATVDGKQVDARIEKATQDFLAAAKQISPAEHLISGYRSVAYQEELYNMYISQEMAGYGTVNQTGQQISKEEAIKDVQTYSQPPGSSEHQTGLAIDMSTVDSLNAEPADIAAKVQALAPTYGFVLRFFKGGEASTGVHYEDWHFRYVGVENAKYMTEHHLTLEEYLKLLPA
ncbi:M15 family metallopeptidase [Lactococcus protaetiae]|uniref:D-alanyl-D-alanine carboxypeptidase family protein n=1 Tax=Lactococcus protaetiae TaxID=2592653 RepID=A0A514ZA07_9LACT|nr:D-alanyl-D-alanine carboxypeptidase family protein [Lactococcus protaetiae]QDK71413.1 D-alanyl-D-alanine carboxypeptidase family protein [Lactococcus protaetiae]